MSRRRKKTSERLLDMLEDEGYSVSRLSTYRLPLGHDHVSWDGLAIRAADGGTYTIQSDNTMTECVRCGIEVWDPVYRTVQVVAKDPPRQL